MKKSDVDINSINRHGPWTVPEYADLYRVSRATVYNWLAAGTLKSGKVGGSRRILKCHDEEFQRVICEGQS